jgi:hypothetical protein
VVSRHPFRRKELVEGADNYRATLPKLSPEAGAFIVMSLVYGKALSVQGVALSIGGVAPDKFVGTGVPPQTPDLWVPASAQGLVTAEVGWTNDTAAREWQVLARRRRA